MTNQTHMNWRSVADAFLEFFRTRDHVVVPSSPLVPAGDPTLLFTNAGMVQFKDVFLGRERRAYTRAATLQKCMRVQGKHNDLDNVGPSPWHHTFFQMLGNFSFGEYFKPEAVAYAWELMTKGYGVDPPQLTITVHTTDQDAAAAWRAVGVPDSRILRLGDTTNFWMMADVGPCGPTSELHYDWGPQHCTCGRSDCSVALDNGCLRWLEIWNLVFMQFDQRADGTRLPLPKPGVDTGMGLERIASVLQDTHDDYRTDLFLPLMDRLQRILGHPDRQRAEHTVAYRVMADHGRAMTFLMADGIVPGNEGRSYVLRMIMRRAMRVGRSAGGLEAERERARAARSWGGGRGEDRRYAQVVRKGISTEFVGYTKHAARARIVAVLVDGDPVGEADTGAQVEVILDRTPFYAEGGGQVGDAGRVRASTGAVEVVDTQRPAGELIVHRGRVASGTIRAGQSVRAEVDVPRRWDIMRNHTATHLLHRALREVLGEHARQAGSLVAPDRLRFDFVHLAALTSEQRGAIERRVNEQILADLPVRAQWMSYEEATRLGAMALFGEKYGDRVRVISVGAYSRELCGGTHLSRTSQAGLFKITAESGVAAGVRRIEAVTGRGAYALLTRQESILNALSQELNAESEALPGRG